MTSAPLTGPALRRVCVAYLATILTPRRFHSARGVFMSATEPSNLIRAPEGMEFDIHCYVVADDGTQIDVKLAGLPVMVPFEGARDPDKILSSLLPSLLPGRKWRFMTRAEIAEYKRDDDSEDEDEEDL